MTDNFRHIVMLMMVDDVLGLGLGLWLWLGLGLARLLVAGHVAEVCGLLSASSYYY